MKKLLVRLHEEASVWRRYGVANVCRDAADAIEVLQKERDELREKLHSVNNERQIEWHAADQMKDRAEKAEAALKAAQEQEPVGKVVAADEYGPILHWYKHWTEVIGSNIYIAAPIPRQAVPFCWVIESPDGHKTAFWQAEQPKAFSDIPAVKRYAMFKEGPQRDIPDGMVLVPKEPTSEMSCFSNTGVPSTIAERIYRAMIATAQMEGESDD